MARNIKEIEESLKLCIDMDSPSVVLPVSIIEKYFPSPRHPSYPNTPCYNLEALENWARSKGWKIKFAATGTKNDKRMVPGIRFTPLGKIDSVPDSAPNPTTNDTEKKYNWYQKPIGLIGIGVVIIIIAAFAIYLIKIHFGIPLD